MQLYGLSWPFDDPIDVEKTAIKNGGKWRYQGKWYGEGLFHHYKALQSELWPWKKWDRWSELILHSLIENRMTLLSGPANSAKTHSVAAFVVSRYICYPFGNCNLISSTDSRSLELRIWGEIKKLWNDALRRYPETPGRIVESKQMIVTDDKVDKATDYRNGLLSVPCMVGGSFVGLGKYCFPAGTEVDTGIGRWPIQFMKVGDIVLSAAGEQRVTAVSNRIASTLARVHLSDGRTIDCTPEHPFLTSMGWVNAIDIPSNTELISNDEAMQILQEGTNEIPRKQEVLQPQVSNGNLEKKLPMVRLLVHTVGGESRFLHSVLRRELEDGATGNCEENDSRQGFRGDRESNQPWNQGESIGMSKETGSNEEVEAHLSAPSEHGALLETNSTSGEDSVGALLRRQAQLPGAYWKIIQAPQRAAVLSGLGMAESKTRRGDRRLLSCEGGSEGEGRSEKRIPERIRVDRVEILKPRGDPRYNASEGGYRVYNLQVEGHPSYSVKGTLVHNCGIKSGAVFLAGDELAMMGPAFYDAISNLRKNPGFKFAGMFNPKDRTDVAGKLAEPHPSDGGWEGYAPTGKTMQWRVKFEDGVCIQLDGRDTPNNDVKPGEPWPFPHLINRDDIANDIAMYGEDSWQVASMDWGVFPKDALARRVITRSMCERFRAQEEPLWSHEPLTYLLCMDAAYGAVGGDRCVAIELVFGKCSDGVTRIAFAGQPMVVPVKMDLEDEEGKPIMPEDQIVNWVKTYCENSSRAEPIPLSHVAFDSTGRGSLVAAFARLWGSEFHAVEFGGVPTERPVSAKIQTPCNVYYDNFVTELWFNTATLITSDQCRGMPTSVMEEGCMRAWEQVKDKKIKVESKSSTTGKPGCKQRMGRSPDLYDSFVVGLELAQRLGFSLGQGGIGASKTTPRWLLELMESRKQLKMGSRLKYR